MSKLIPIIYKNMNYPSHIKANIHEVSGNFYKEKLIVKSPYSLHSEPSSVPKAFCSKIVNELGNINKAQKGNIAQLWHDKEWANEFFIFIEWLIGSNNPPEVLEIHPPFDDYCKSFDQFLDVFNVFYQKFVKKYPNTTIVIENRFGTRYKDGKFLLSKCSDILDFCGILSKSNIDLKIVLDYPQLFSSETKIKKPRKKFDNWMGENPSQLVEKIIKFNLDLEKHKKLIDGFHMWGKLNDIGKLKWIPHAGNFDTFFSNNKELKQKFLSSVFSTFDDDKARYFVPEVNSGVSDFHSIVNDMEKEGFIFLSKKCYMSTVDYVYDYYLNQCRDRVWLEKKEIGTIIMLHSAVNASKWYALQVKDGKVIDSIDIATMFLRLDSDYYAGWKNFLSKEKILTKICVPNIEEIKPSGAEIAQAKSRRRLLIDGDELETYLPRLIQMD